MLRKNDKKETAIAAPDERAVEAWRCKDEIRFGRAAKIAGWIFLIRDSRFEIQSRRIFHISYFIWHMKYGICLLIKPQSLLRDVAPGELLRLSDSPLAQFRAQGFVVYDFDNGVRQRPFVVRVYQQRGAAGDFGQAGDVAGHDRRPAGHRFEGGQPKPFEERRIHESAGRAIQRGQIFVGDVSGQDHVIGPSLFLHLVEDFTRQPQLTPHDHQLRPEVFALASQSRVGPDQSNQVLARLQTADGQQEIARDAEAPANLFGLVGDGRLRRKARFDAVICDNDLFRWEFVNVQQILP